MKSARRIGVLGFDDVNGIDLVGPLEAFGHATFVDPARSPRPPYEVVVIGLSRRTFRTESGLLFKPHFTLRTAPPLDTVVIPGGCGLRNTPAGPTIAAWIAERAPRIRRIATVCTGVYALAPTGLLDGRKVATHWRFADDVARRFPKLQIDGNALYIKDGSYYTSGGVTAGIDLALAMIEEDLGPRAALAVARELVVYLKRAGGQEQYSEPLRFQMRAADRFADLVAWIAGHLDRDLSVAVLAARACLGPRQFSRRFAATFGLTPADYVEAVRMSEARRRLAAPENTIEQVALSIGFRSADAFRRAFERRLGVAPGAYRERFGFVAARSSGYSNEGALQ